MNTYPSNTVVLVVEDDWWVRQEIVADLHQSGLQVLEASTAEAAIDLLRDKSVDVLITDIQLGGPLTGWDLAQMALAITPAIRVIYASGNPDDESRRVPGSLFFSKPCRTVEIVAACCESK